MNGCENHNVIVRVMWLVDCDGNGKELWRAALGDTRVPAAATQERERVKTCSGVNDPSEAACHRKKSRCFVHGCAAKGGTT